MGVFGEKHTSLTREQKRQLIHQADTHKLRPTEVCDWVLQTWGLRIARVTVYSILHKQRASLMAGHRDLYQSMQKLSASSLSSSSHDQACTLPSSSSTTPSPASDAHMKRCRKGSTSSNSGRITKRAPPSPVPSPRSDSHRRNSSASSVYMSCSPSPAPAELTFTSTSTPNSCSSSHTLSHHDASRCSHANPAGSAGSAHPNASAGALGSSFGSVPSLALPAAANSTSPPPPSSASPSPSRAASGAKWEGQLKRVREPASVELDRAMVQFLKSDKAVDANGRRLNDAELQSHALRLAKSIPSAARMRCSFGWLRHFKRRLGVQWAADRLGRYRWIIEMDHEEDGNNSNDHSFLNRINGEPSTDASPPPSESSLSPLPTQLSSPTLSSPALDGSPLLAFPTAFEDHSLTHEDLHCYNNNNNNKSTNIASNLSRKRKSDATALAAQPSSTPSVSGTWPMLTHLKQETDQDHHALHQVLYHTGYPTQPLGSATAVAALHGPSRQHHGYQASQQLFASTGPLTPLDTLPPLVMPNNTHGSPDLSAIGSNSLSSAVKHESSATAPASSAAASATTTTSPSFGMSVDGGMRKVPTKEEALDLLQSLLLYYEQDHHYTGEQQTLLLPRWIHQQRQIMQQTPSDDGRLSWLRAAPPTSLFHSIDFSALGGAATSGTASTTTASAPPPPARTSSSSSPPSSLSFLGLASPAPSVTHSPTPFQLQQPHPMPMGMHPLALPMHHQAGQGAAHGLHTMTPMSPPASVSAAAAAAAAATTVSLLSAAASAGLLTTTTTSMPSSSSTTPSSTATIAVGSAGTNTVSMPSSSSSSSSSTISSLASPIEQQMYFAHQQHVAETQLARMMYSGH
ncbi:hypothetical protein DFQ27_007566 [Actinomortierella ambigua]|uniref:HTH CENPB-type domain-containing protein n=1 Tax=Actinomortierella ambigua TaxID=1343610 RepID=A0A9P6UDD1_9FUNG|nr:hypothetical protein DFQ27_007566 [Actinomortierella ambigua]